MADKKITLDIAINTADSANTLKEIKTSLKELKNAALDFGEGSDEFLKATQKAGQLQDKLNDVNDTVRVLAGNNAENLSKSFSNVAAAGIGAFGAIQGAQALFGEENKDLQKTLVKLQALMNLSNGIREFANIGQAAKDFKVVLASLVPALFAETAAVEGATVAQTGLNTAMLANPIGAIIIAITALIAAYAIFVNSSEESIDVTDGLTQSEDDYRKSLNDTNLEIDRRLKNLRDNIKLLGSEGKEREILAVNIQKENGLLDVNIQKQKDLADTLARLAELRIKYSQSTDENLNTQLFNEIKKLRAEGLAISLKSKEEEKLISENAGQEILNIEKKYAEKAAEQAAANSKKINAEKEKDKQDLLKAIEAEFNAENEKDVKRGEKELERIKKENADKLIAEAEFALAKKELDVQIDTDANNQRILTAQIRLAQNQQDFNAQIELLNAQKDAELANVNLTAQERILIEQNTANQIAAIEKQVRDAKIQGVQNTLTTIGNLAELFAGKSRKQQEKAFKIQKAVATANAIIDTYKAATGAYASLSGIPVVGPALGAIAAAAAVTAGLLNVKKIQSQKFDSGGNSSGDGGAGSSAASVPNVGGGIASSALPTSVTPQVPTGVTLFGQNNNANNLGTTPSPIQAYVVESQISDTQARLLAFRTRSEIR